MRTQVEAPDFNLDGRVALITGAGRGIGLGIAKALASAGCAVAIQDIDEKVAQREADALEKSGVRAIALGGDITNVALADKLVRETVKKLGGLHILANNASVQSTQHWTKLELKEFDRTMHANVFTPIRLCQAAEKILRKQRWGRIVNVGSIQQLTGNETMLAYAMSKAALENMTIALARDFAGDGVTVNNLAPGYFHTIRNPQLSTPQQRRAAGARIPAGRVGEPADVAGIALTLCSNAGQYITGQTIYVDGGISIRFGPK
jgi:NAD(P)-dependent dehydrogenase (short-subunit alcohol dehydrogenase family)